MIELNEVQINNFLNKVEIDYKEPNGCWLWVGCKCPKGYGVVNLNNKAYRSHRVAYEYWMEKEIPRDKVINHLCSVRNCVNPHHLEVVTQRENVRKGLTKGPKNHFAKLTQEIVDEIRSKWATGNYLKKELAKEYNLSATHVGDLIRMKWWN